MSQYEADNWSRKVADEIQEKQTYIGFCSLQGREFVVEFSDRPPERFMGWWKDEPSAIYYADTPLDVYCELE